MSRRALILATLLATVLLTAGAGVARAEASFAVYKGSFTQRIDDVGPRGSVWQLRALSWVMTISDDGRGRVRRALVAQGRSITIFSGGGSDSCTVRQHGGSVLGPLTIGPGHNRRYLSVGTYIPNSVLGPKAPRGVNGDLVVSGGDCNGLTFDGVLFSTPNRDGSLSTGNPCYGYAKAPQFVTPRVDDLLRDATRRIDRTQTAYRVPGCKSNDTITATREIHATLQTGLGGPDRTGPTPSEQQKAFATSDLLTSLLRAQLPCGYVALGTTAALWAAIVPGGSASAAYVPAEVLLSAGAPLCATYAKRIFDDVNIANDPPAGNINAIAKPAPTPSAAQDEARIAPCDSRVGDQMAFCTQLRATAADEIAAAQRVTAVADALLITVDREARARQLHKSAALRRQQRAGMRLLATLQAASLAENATWAAIPALLSSHGLDGTFTLAQDSTAIRALLGQLRHDGVSAAAVRRLAASALVAGPVDLLAR